MTKAHGIEKNKKATTDPDKKPKGIPCPLCGGTRWRLWNTRKSGVRILRVRVCKVCNHRIRTSETLQSANAPRMFFRDPVTRKKTAEKPQ